MASCARAVTICQVGRRATNLAKGARASAPAETTLRLTSLHRRSHWSATSTPQKDLKPILVTRSHCGQDGRAPSAQRRRESVGRVPHVRDAPELVVQTRLLGWNPAVRALTGAATLICSAVAAVCDRPGFLVIHLRDDLATPMLGKNGRRSQNAATEVNWRAPEGAQ